MASSTVPSTLTMTLSFSSGTLHQRHASASSPFSSGILCLRQWPCCSRRQCRRLKSAVVRAQSLDFSGSFFEDDGNAVEDGGPSAASVAATVAVDKEEPQCPPGLRQYETMAVLRPDMSEDERLSLTQKYEEILVAGGGMYVEVFNRGVIPLAYSIKKKNKAGETNTYMDGIYLLFTYFTKPESMANLESRLIADDNVIRSSSFKIRKRKY